MRETALTRGILRALNAHPDCKAIKTKGLEVGTPDIVGCYRGQAFLVEVKATAKVTKMQRWRLDEWARAGAVAVVARPDFSVQEFLEGIGEAME